MERYKNVVDFAKYIISKEEPLYIYGECPRSFYLDSYLSSNGITISNYLISDGFEIKDKSKNIIKLSEIESIGGVIISVNYKYYNEVIATLINKGIKDIYFLSGEDKKNLQNYNTYYEVNDLDAMYAEREMSYKYAQKIYTFLLEQIKINSIVDFGCGCGAWLKAIKDLDSNIKILGIDNSDTDRSLYLKDDEFLKNNFAMDKKLDIGKFDMAMSIECAEHFEECYADNFIDNLCNTSDIILFSAAIKNQGGEHHVNERYMSYWKEKFMQRGYKYIDCIRDKFWNDNDMSLYYKQNCILYVKSDKYEEINKLFPQKNEFKDMVHPDLYNLKMDEMIKGLF